MVLTGQSSLDGMLLLGSNLYWISNSAIMTVPTTGGTATAVYSEANINSALGTDGTLLYFTTTTSTGSTINSVSATGTNMTTLASGVFDFLTAPDPGPQIFVVNGTVYVGGANNGQCIIAVSTAGGTPTELLPLTGPVIQALLWADTSGVYFSTPSDVEYVALSGGTPSVMLTTGIDNEPAPGALAVIGGTAYFVPASSPATLYESTGGAMATSVMAYTGVNGNRAGIMPDGNGNLIATLAGGIYDVSVSTGAPTMLESNLMNMDGTHHALDAAHIYYSTVGNSVFSIWSHAR